MVTKTKDSLKYKILSLIKGNMPNGVGFNKIWKEFKGRKGKANYYSVIGSKSTLSNILKGLSKEGFIQRDLDNRLYKITAEGQKYLKRSEIVEMILSSTALDSLFDWSAKKEQEKAEEISAAYMLVETRKEAPHSLALLHERLSRTQPFLWHIDVLNYALKVELLTDKDIETVKNTLKGKASLETMELLQKKLKSVWKELFDGVQRLTIVETVSPQLLLENIEKLFM